MRLRLGAVAAVLAFALSGCQVSLAAGVTVDRRGGGTVTAGVGLDAEALQQVGDLPAALRIDDLRAAGWSVADPRKEGDGLTWVRAAKRFADIDQANQALAQLSGPGGPFRDLRLARTHGLLRSTLALTGAVDLSAGVTGLSDPDLAAKLADVDLGLDMDGLKRRFGPDVGKALRVEMAADLPGRMKANTPERPGGRAVWAPAPGQAVELRAQSRALNMLPLVVLSAGAVLLAAGAVALLVGRARRTRSREA